MRYLPYFLAPVAALAAPAAYATVYLTTEQAQALMFPGETLHEAFQTLTADQMAAISKAAGVDPLSNKLKVWRSSKGGWFILDEVVGKHEFITYALALDSTGGVRDVEIMDYRETYGGQVRDRAWREQFVGKHTGDGLTLGHEIKNISGATLSCKHITDGVRRLLVTYAIALKSDNTTR